MAATAFRSHEPPAQLIPRLERCLPAFCEVSELDGYVLVEHRHLDHGQLEAAARGALERIYGEEWPAMVDGLGS